MDVTEITRLHNVVAKCFKEYEQRIGRLPPVEVLNELRYALRAMVEILQLDQCGGDSTQRRELLARVQHALLCAYHDMLDGLVIEIPRMLDELRIAFPVASREVAGERLIEIANRLASVEREIARTRGSPTDRPEIYEELYTNWFATLMDDYAFLRRARIDIADHHEAARRSSWRKYWKQAAIGLPTAFVIGWLASNLWPI